MRYSMSSLSQQVCQHIRTQQSYLLAIYISKRTHLTLSYSKTGWYIHTCLPFILIPQCFGGEEAIRQSVKEGEKPSRHFPSGGAHGCCCGAEALLHSLAQLRFGARYPSAPCRGKKAKLRNNFKFQFVCSKCGVPSFQHFLQEMQASLDLFCLNIIFRYL